MNALLASGATTAADINTFTGYATAILTWFITSFKSILTFMLENPICFVGLIMAMVVAAIGTLRHIIGG